LTTCYISNNSEWHVINSTINVLISDKMSSKCSKLAYDHHRQWQYAQLTNKEASQAQLTNKDT
jgi:hypothetical protein